MCVGYNKILFCIPFPFNLFCYVMLYDVHFLTYGQESTELRGSWMEGLY
jgi:hypothetical protein